MQNVIACMYSLFAEVKSMFNEEVCFYTPVISRNIKSDLETNSDFNLKQKLKITKSSSIPLMMGKGFSHRLGDQYFIYEEASLFNSAKCFLKNSSWQTENATGYMFFCYESQYF